MIFSGDSYFLYKYGSYPPPLPLWAISKPRRKFVPYFGLDQTTKPPTTTTTQEPTPSCQHLPPSCWSTPQYLPLPLNCIDICSLDSVSTLQPTLSTCSTFPSGNLPLQCIQIIEVNKPGLSCVKLYVNLAKQGSGPELSPTVMVGEKRQQLGKN